MTVTERARALLVEAGKPDLADRLEPNRAGHPMVGMLRGEPGIDRGDLLLAYGAATAAYEDDGSVVVVDTLGEAEVHVADRVWVRDPVESGYVPREGDLPWA